jgi:hypothetical protein
MQNAIALCKERLPLPDLLVRLGLFRNPPGPGSHPCPLHQERTGAAFSMHRPRGAWLWKCHGKCAASGDEISLLRFVDGTNNRAAIQRYRELCDAPGTVPRTVSKPRRRSVSDPSPESQNVIQLPDRLHSGSYADCEQVARLRAVPVSTITDMSRNGFLAFGTVCGAPSWVVLDDMRKVAEARRLDGRPYAALHGLSERKTHTHSEDLKKTGHLVWHRDRGRFSWWRGPGILSRRTTSAL